MRRDTPIGWLRYLTGMLQRHGIEDAESTARLMVTTILGCSMGMLAADNQPIEEQAALALEQALQRRLQGEPVQYILGQAYFYGLAFRVTPDVLIPRMDTEILVEIALKKMPTGARVLDVCTGSGCIALTLKHERPDCNVSAVDLSGPALSIAKENGRKLGLSVNWHQGDLCDPVKNEVFDLIVSNPPYISETEYRNLSPLVREHEPAMALLAGPEGLDIYKRLVCQAKDRLAQNGWVVWEIGSTQAEDVQTMLKQAGFLQVAMETDMAGLPRVVYGRKG